MPDKPTLTGFDYVNLPLKLLVTHRDYNGHVYRIVQAIMNMTNEQLEKIDVSKLGGKT